MQPASGQSFPDCRAWVSLKLAEEGANRRVRVIRPYDSYVLPYTDTTAPRVTWFSGKASTLRFPVHRHDGAAADLVLRRGEEQDGRGDLLDLRPFGVVGLRHGGVVLRRVPYRRRDGGCPDSPVCHPFRERP